MSDLEGTFPGLIALTERSRTPRVSLWETCPACECDQPSASPANILGILTFALCLFASILVFTSAIHDAHLGTQNLLSIPTRKPRATSPECAGISVRLRVVAHTRKPITEPVVRFDETRQEDARHLDGFKMEETLLGGVKWVREK